MALSDNVTSVLTVSIQTSIQSHVDSFPPTMRRVADVILERPQIVMENTISELARACDTSEASIVRFCRALGFTGYPQLKLQLAAELAKESAEFGGNGDGPTAQTSVRPTPSPRWSPRSPAARSSASGRPRTASTWRSCSG